MTVQWTKLFIWASFLMGAFVSSSMAMGKNPDSKSEQTQTTSPATTTSPNTSNPANPYYNSPSNTGTSAPLNQGSSPIHKGAGGTPTPTTNDHPPANHAATGVGPYGGSPSGPSGGASQ